MPITVLSFSALGFSGDDVADPADPGLQEAGGRPREEGGERGDVGEPRAGPPPRRPLLSPRLHPRELRTEPAGPSRQPAFRNTVILEHVIYSQS